MSPAPRQPRKPRSGDRRGRADLAAGAALLAIALVTSLLIAELHERADRHRQAELHTAHVDQVAGEVNKGMELLLDPAEEDDKDPSAVRASLARLMSERDRLMRVEPGSRSQGLDAAVSLYSRRAAGVLRAFESGSVGGAGARAADAEAPFQALRRVARPGIRSYGRSAARALDIAEVGSTVIVALAAMLIALLMRWNGRWRRTAAVAAAEHEAIQDSEARFRALEHNSSDVMTVLQPNLTIRYLSASAQNVLGHDADELTGRSFASLVHPDDLDSALTLCGGEPASAELRLATGAGAWLVCEARSNPRLDDPLIQGVVLNVRDVSERKRLEDDLRHQEFHDPLTGLPNRALFQDRVQAALGGPHPVTVMVVDVDDLKALNDGMTHDAGDRVLSIVATRLRAVTRGRGAVARLGSDEFGVLFLDLDSTHASALAERVLEAVCERCELQGRQIPVSATIGVVSAEPGSIHAEELIRNADIAMDRAKRRAKGTHATFEPGMECEAQRRLELKAELLRALARGEIALHYQPIVDVETLEVVGLEALARWRHPERGLIPPADFIPLAEETGVIVALGAHVLETACRELVQHQAVSPALAGVCISVNVSVRELREPGFVDGVRRVLHITGLDPGRLVLEITESVMMIEREASLQAMRELRALGARVAVDDFGTGYSSLGALHQFPLDIVKVDRVFTSRLGEDGPHGALAQTVMAVGGALGRVTVAEGVESVDQLVELRGLGCELAQGFYFAKPLPIDEVADLIAAGPPWVTAPASLGR